jgi:hypothetical protein
VANAGCVKDAHVAALASVAGGLGEEVAFDVIDDDRVRPGEKLADREEALTAAGRGDNQQVAQFPSLLARADAKDTIEPADAQEKRDPPVEDVSKKDGELVDPCKAGVMEFVRARKKEASCSIESNQQAEGQLPASG